MLWARAIEHRSTRPNGLRDDRFVDDVQHQRAKRYADGTYALVHARISDGPEGVFDLALTNGLAAIVAYEIDAQEWQGTLQNGRGRLRPARELLKIIHANAEPIEPGTVHVLRAGQPKWAPSPDGGEDQVPIFTTVHVSTLCEALDITQSVRHAREPREPHMALSERHLRALQELHSHPALSRADILGPDRTESVIVDADVVESCRAARYYASLGDTERTRRETTDYDDDFYDRLIEGSPADECPICLNRSLIASHLDREIAEISVGTCIACSYRRTDDVAEYLAMLEALDRRSSS